MPTEPIDYGYSSGFSVEEDSSGGYRWSAFGPVGTPQGHVDSRAEADAAARDAEQELNGPRSIDG
jgi:hypothetical protein